MGINASKHEIKATQHKEANGKADVKDNGNVQFKGMKKMEDDAIDSCESSGCPGRHVLPLDSLKQESCALLKQRKRGPTKPPLLDSSTVEDGMAKRYVNNGQKPNVSGHRLMCVWQALYATDPLSKGSAPKSLVRTVTTSFAENPIVKFSAKDFDKFFQASTVDFDQYADYVHSNLAHSADLYKAVENAIESKCWEMSKTIYRLRDYGVTESDAHKLWQLFSRMCEPSTLPPTINKEEANWIGEVLSTQLSQCWDYSYVQHNMSYGELMGILAKKCFSLCSQAAASEAIEDLHDWLVQEVAMTGWLTMRTRNHANWTSWLQLWFVLGPGQLDYYENNKMETKRGEFTLTSISKIEKLPELKAHHNPFRFKVINSRYLELELEGVYDKECRAWISALMEVVDAAKSGTISMQGILRDKQVQKKSGICVSVDEASSRLKSLRLQKNVLHENPSSEPRPKTMQQKLPSTMNIQDDKFKQQVDRIQEIFCKVDLDRNGFINAEEFKIFIKDMGLSITDDEIFNIFSNIDTSGDGILTIEEFTHYFINNVLDDTGESTGETEASLQSAFLEADRDGTGTVDFREFAEYLWEKRRSMRMSQVMSAFDNISAGKGEVNFDQFKDLFVTQETNLALSGNDGNSVQGCLQNMFHDTNAEGITSFLEERWHAFTAFKRCGQSGASVMTSGDEMVADVLPGQYNLVDLACFNDLPPIEPLHAIIKNVCWVKSPPGGHGQAIFPADFDGKIPIDIATTEHLRYYGASLADSNQVQVSLLYRHGIQDFTYENTYLSDYVQEDAGGAGIEMHDFAHLDCPMANDSGHFVMGKMEGADLHLTAFKVPTRHTLYVPGGVIHSNDYLKGTWRTMLSDEAEVDHYHIVKYNKDDHVIKFVFKFEH